MPITKNLELYYINRPVADLAALKAIVVTSIVDGFYVEVISMSPTGGKFVWISTSAETVDDINVVLPTGHVGNGRWLREDFKVQLTAGGKIIATQVDIPNPFVYKGQINLAADFPTPALVQIGWFYTIGTNVTDNDPTKTNTGQSFLAGEEIVWNGAAWDNLGGSAIWTDDGADVKPIVNTRNINAQLGVIKSSVATGTAPFTIASTTKVTNLNSDQLDGNDESAFALLAGRAGGQSLIGGTAASNNLRLTSTSNATKGLIQIEDGDVIRFLTTNYETLVLNNNDVPNKKYVDDAVSAENLWDRAGTVLSPHTSGDSVSLPGSGSLINVGTATGIGTPAITMTFANSGYAAPSNCGLNSDGDKWVFWNSATSYKGAIGFNTREMWFQSTDVTAAENQFRFFGGSASVPVELFSMGDVKGFVWNDTGIDMNFRCEGDTDANLFVLDAGLDQACFGTATPIAGAKLTVSTTLAAGSLNVANGIVQTSAAGLFSTSTALPNGTTATTQAASDNSTKVATTAYVDSAVGSSNLFDKSGTIISTHTANDSVALGAAAYYYLGDPTADGCWRIAQSSNDLSFERRESSVWVSKGKFLATP